MKKVILSIEGMTCSACSNGLEKYLQKQEGIIKANVNLVMATAYIEYEDNVSIKKIESYIKKIGFKSLGISKLNDNVKKRSIISFIIYGILALLTMYISMASMLDFPIMDSLYMELNPKNYALCLFVLTIPFIFYGFSIIKNGIKNFIHKMPNMDTLVGIGVISSFIYSTYGVVMVLLNHYEYANQLYFESTTFMIYFIKLGRYIDQTIKQKAKDAIKKLVTITPKVAKIKVNDEIKEITIDEVKQNDILICFAGDKIAVDGEIIRGKCHVDESFITGESKPIQKNENDKVIAGSINYDGTILYRAEKIGKDSTISEIVNLVLEATNTKAHISLLADKISSYFVPVVIVIALITFIVCLMMNIPFDKSLIRFVTVLVVACPCSLGLATPLAIVVSEGIYAERGILVKSSEIIEKISKVDTIVFDKTGTLTQGNLSISKIHNYSNYKEDKLLEIIASIEYSSNHPIALGIMNYIKNKNIEYDESLTIKTIVGYGIAASDSENIYYACNNSLIEKLNIENTHKQDEINLSNEGNSIVYIVENNRIIGLIGIKDLIRPEAKKIIIDLKRMNIDVAMLTGDNLETAKIIGKQLGITNIISSVVPKQKVEYIKNLQKNKKQVVMVGDGINDAPSLTMADVGISLKTGTEIANSSADVILINDDLSKIVDLIDISKKTLTNIKQNLFWTFIYNIIMIPIACGLLIPLNIQIDPMIACFSMILSSLIVILNAISLNIKI